MELTLRYKGPLLSVGTDRRVREKHQIRCALHKQLKEYWQQTPRLREMYDDLKGLQTAKRAHDKFVVDRPLSDNTKFWWRHPLCGFDFIPLLTSVHMSHCALRIRLYRKAQGILFEGGDIDNRLKTFFDALQVPKDENQMPKDIAYDQNPKEWPPFFCLLDDDGLVTRLNIESFKLLSEIPREYSDIQGYVEFDVDVTIIPITPMAGTLDFLFKG